MSKRLVIAGAGGFGRGVHGWVTSSPRFLRTSEINSVVFIDDFHSGEGLPAPLVGTVNDYRPIDSDLVICAVGIIKVRQLIVESLSSRDAHFATFIDDRAVLCGGVEVGEGSVICPGSVLSADVTLGKQVHVNFNCSIGHDANIGDFSTLSPAVNIMGQVSSGDSVFYGGGAIVLPRLNIAGGSLIGAGAVVTKPVLTASVLVGNPAKHITPAGE